MALKACKECGGTVSSDAAACPACGKPQKRTPIGCGGGLVLMVLVAWLGSAIVRSVDDQPEAKPRPVATKEVAKQTPERTAQEMKESALDQAAYLAARALRDSARNPERFSVSEALAMDGTNSACITARAENGFGGMNVVKLVYTANPKPVLLSSEDAGFSRAWNAKCAGQSGRDITRFIQVAIDLL